MSSTSNVYLVPLVDLHNKSPSSVSDPFHFDMDSFPRIIDSNPKDQNETDQTNPDPKHKKQQIFVTLFFFLSKI